MYIADLFNKNKMFQRFGGWFRDTKISFFSRLMRLKNVKDLTKVWQAWKKSIQVFETLLGFSTSIILTLNQIKQLEQKCIMQYDELANQLHVEENRILFWSHKLVNLLSKISPIINSIRIMENLILEQMSKEIGRPLPENMFILIKNTHKSYEFIPVELWNKIENYWKEVGKPIRDYRHINNYFFSLTAHSYIELEPVKKLVILLPDNPQVENSLKFTYNTHIDAIQFVEESFQKFHDLVEEISGFFGYEPTYILQGWSFVEYQNLPAKTGTVALVIKNPESNKGIEVINEDGKPVFNKVRPI